MMRILSVLFLVLLGVVAVLGLEDGRYYLRYNGKLECQKGKYLTYSSSCSSNKLRMSTRRSTNAVWAISSRPDGMRLTATGKSLSCRRDLSTKNTKCVSRWAGLKDNSSTWTLKRYRSPEGDQYVLKSIKGSSKSSKCKSQVLSIASSGCLKFRLILNKDTRKERSGSKWELVRVDLARPPPQPASPEMIPSPPPANRECAQQSPVYSHYDYQTSAGIRSVCEALWALPDEYTLIPSFIGKEITCREDTYESPRETQWASPRPPVCDLLQQVASGDPRFDISDTIRDPCGLWFWCSNPAVGDEGLIVMQWNLQLQRTFG